MGHPSSRGLLESPYQNPAAAAALPQVVRAAERRRAAAVADARGAADGHCVGGVARRVVDGEAGRRPPGRADAAAVCS